MTLNLIYHFDNNRDIDYIENKSRSPLYVLAMYGNSANKARMSGGRYDGPIWNLKTNTRRATDVSGDMSDDKSSKAYSRNWLSCQINMKICRLYNGRIM